MAWVGGGCGHDAAGRRRAVSQRGMDVAVDDKNTTTDRARDFCTSVGQVRDAAATRARTHRDKEIAERRLSGLEATHHCPEAAAVKVRVEED